MSNATEDQELAELEQQIKQAAEAEKEKAAGKAIEPETPSPEPEPADPHEAVAPEPAPVTLNESAPTKSAQDDPMEWAKKKGVETYEDAVRALQQKEIEFHKRNQAGHPGYRDINGEQPVAPPPQAWQPAPQMNNGFQPQFYQPPYQPQPDVRQVAAQLFPEMNPDDAKVFIPAMLEVARTAARQERLALERQFGPQLGAIQRTADRNNELMQLMQDSAFRDPRVQKEVHAVLDADPSIFQRERTPYAAAYEKALANMARKQLQQGVSDGNNAVKGNTPPVTAGGGNGSANTVRIAPTEREMESWTPEQMKAYMTSNGRIVPKAK